MGIWIPDVKRKSKDVPNVPFERNINQGLYHRIIPFLRLSFLNTKGSDDIIDYENPFVVIQTVVINISVIFIVSYSLTYF